MCGICGIVADDAGYLIAEATIVAMRDSLTHRGPDDAGHYLRPGVALASRRLSILDLSQRGHMPMATQDGRFWISHNGEIYNFQDIRRSLQARGYSFRSDTDTEVLLNLFVDEGPAMLNRLNGMFAFAIWDSRDRTLFVARDRLGVKPLYYAVHEGCVYFGSEEKALFAAGVPADFDHDTWAELLCFRFTAGERTPFTHVRRLLPGHWMTWRNGHLQTHRWWNLSERSQAIRSQLPQNPVVWFRETFDDAVRLRRISDVPVGVLLSGGLDSSSVATSLAHAAGKGVSSFTVRFEDAAYDEGPLAHDVASQWELDAHELTVRPADLLGRLRHAAWLNDEPLAHGNDIHLFAISQYAKSRVTVLLSGEGADETLGGYVRYRPLRYPQLLGAVAQLLRQSRKAVEFRGRADKLYRWLQVGGPDRLVLFNACDVWPSDLAELGISERSSFQYRENVVNEARLLYPTDLTRQAMYSDLQTFLCSVLDRNDRMTMGASIECRVPFLDYRLVEMAAALPSSILFAGFKGKNLLRKAVGHRLPASVRRHPKWGFGVPWKDYLRQVDELRSVLLDLHKASIIADSPLSETAVKARVRSFLAGDDQPFAVLLQLLMIVLSADARQRPSTHATEPSVSPYTIRQAVQ
jgi:asparagine synthase (glutamine-hydrolysing)